MNLDLWTEIFKIVFIASAAIQFFYYLFFYSRLAFYMQLSGSNETPPVSVIIAARNEDDNLLENLPSILEQDYPTFEVVVINDSSWDESTDVLKAFSEQYKILEIVEKQEHERFDGGKKLALTLGIKRAKYERLLFTDADCKPASKQWIRQMMKCGEGNKIILGYSPFAKENGFLNSIIRFENWLSGMNYMSFALAKIPYMGVGRNLSYTKSLFFSSGGFRKHYHIPSGDDDLFVNENASEGNIAICLEPEATVVTKPKKTLKSYFAQKRRHLSTGWRYKFHQKFLLTLQPLSMILFYISGIGLIVIHSWVYIVGGLIALRILLQFFIFRRSSRWLGQRDLLIFTPILEILVVALLGVIHLTNLSGKKTTWKS